MEETALEIANTRAVYYTNISANYLKLLLGNPDHDAMMSSGWGWTREWYQGGLDIRAMSPSADASICTYVHVGGIRGTRIFYIQKVASIFGNFLSVKKKT